MLVKVRVDAPSGTITLNRPECCNALSGAMVEELTVAFEDLLQERKVRAVVLAAGGNHFCAGTDLKELNHSYEDENAFLNWHHQVGSLKDLIELMLRFPKPIITAVHGTVAGSGLALALAADTIIAGQSARVRLPEATRGLNAGLTIPLLAFRTGSATAAQLLLFGKSLSAEQAQEAKIFQEIVHDDLVWVRAIEMAKSAAQGSRESHQMSKRMLNESIGEAVFTLLNIAAADMASARTTEAAREGVKAFIEKRQPNWDAF